MDRLVREKYIESIRRVEDSVNSYALEVLKPQPFKIDVVNFRPETMDELFVLLQMELEAAGIPPSDYTGSDLSFDHPSSDNYPALDFVTANWSNGSYYTLAQIKDTGPVIFISDSDKAVETYTIPVDDIELVLRALGIPPELMNSRTPLEDILYYFSQRSDSFSIRRERNLPFHPEAAIRLVHQSRLFTEPGSTENALVDELRVIMWDYEDIEIGSELYQELNMPTMMPIYANHFVFRQDETASRWVYKSAYKGPVGPSDITDCYVDYADILVRPNQRISRIFSEALSSVK